jgi:non-ribosomal peptide synthetase component E (peptide arylation enzyme)
MTLDEALTKAAREYDAIAARIMCDCEVMYVDMGATAEELAAGLERERRTIAEGWRQLHESIRVAYATPDGASVKVH